MAVSFSTRLTRSLVVSLLILSSWVLYTQHYGGRGAWWARRMDWLSTGASALTLLNIATLLLYSGRPGLRREINRWLIGLNVGLTGVVSLLLLGVLVLRGPFWIPNSLRSYLIATPFLTNIYLLYHYKCASSP